MGSTGGTINMDQILALLQICCICFSLAFGANKTQCKPNDRNEFIFKVNFHTPGRMGEFEVEGCEGTSPVLEIEQGKVYTLVQQDKTNWMHPLGLAYFPDGAHEDVPELEYPTPDDCREDQFSCFPGEEVKEAPLYSIDGVTESFNDWNNGITGGLDVYEPAFKVPQDQWSQHNYSVLITIPEGSTTREFFYFCHIHKGMSGLIKVHGGGNEKVEEKPKWNPEKYYADSNEFDENCGTSQVSIFHNEKEKFCPGQNFLCETRHNKEFSTCMEAIGCKMNYEMRVEEDSNPLVVFMDQMIPHHVNAVNMARIALKHATNAEGYDDEELDVPGLLRDIINKQNEQIQEMEEWLKRHRNQKVVGEYCEPPSLGNGGNSPMLIPISFLLAISVMMIAL